MLGVSASTALRVQYCSADDLSGAEFCMMSYCLLRQRFISLPSLKVSFFFAVHIHPQNIIRSLLWQHICVRFRRAAFNFRFLLRAYWSNYLFRVLSQCIEEQIINESVVNSMSSKKGRQRMLIGELWCTALPRSRGFAPSNCRRCTMSWGVTPDLDEAAFKEIFSNFCGACFCFRFQRFLPITAVRGNELEKFGGSLSSEF